MESSGGNYHPPGTQDEPFFDLLQQSSAPISVPKTGYTNSSASAAYNAPMKMENSADFNFGGDDVLPSFDFQPIRTTPASASSTLSGGSTSATAVRIEEGRQGSPPSSYTSYEPMVRRSREPPPTYETPVTRPLEHEKESFDSATAAAVERTMKKYADNLLRVLEGMTGRLSQLESSTQRLEHLFEEIKNVIGDTHGEADGKFRSLESHILEVQRGVQVLRDRQEIFEAQSQLAKLQLTAKGESASLHSAPSAPPPPPPPPSPPSMSESPSQLVRASSGKALMEAPQRQVSETPSYYQPQPQLQLQQMPSLPAPPPQQPHTPPQQPVQQQPPSQQQHALQQQQQVQPQLQQQPMQRQQPGILQNEVSHQLQQQPLQLQQPGVLQNEVSHQALHQQQPPPPPPSPSPQQQLSHPPQHQHQPQPQPQPPHPPPAYSQQPQQQQQQSPYNQQQQPTSQSPPMPNYGPPPEHPSYGQHPQGPHPGSHHVPLPPSSYPSDLPSYHPSYGPPRPGLPPPPPPPSQQSQQPHNVGMYEPSMGRSGSSQLTLPAPPYLPQGHPPHYEAQGMNPASGYPGSSYRVAQPVPSAPSGSSGSGGYPRLPVAQPLPHAMPTGGGGSGTPSGNPSLSTNRVPIDEVIDKVTAMGFSKDQVRAVVRRLTENGQSVDLNIVLDKLMNGDSSQAPPKGWFGR